MVSAPEALEGELSLVGLKPWPFVGNGQPGDPVVAFDGNRDAAVRRSVAPAVLEEIVDRAFERSSVSAHPDRVGGNDLDSRLASRGRRGELVEIHLFLG